MGLAGQDQLPVRQSDWPLQALGPAQPDRTWTASYNLNLIGADQLPSRQLDWPNSRGRPPALQDWVRGLNLDLLPPPGPLGLVFNQFDWPWSPPPRQAPQQWTWSYNRNLLGRDSLPFRQTDWPLQPRGAPPAIQDWVWPLGAQFIPAGGPPPVVVPEPWSGFISNMGRMMVRRG